MAKKPTFNFGVNAKPRKPKASGNKSSKGKGGNKSNAWRAYTSNAPIPD
jgi:hypothetical protein